jgi:hypothetical protein
MVKRAAKKYVLGLITGFFGLSILLSPIVGAQASNSNAAQGMQISPTLVELNAARGKTYSIKINILNPTSSDLEYTSSVIDFGAPSDESGSPKPLEDGTLPDSASVRTWIEALPEFTLGAHKSTNITAEITIPDNAEPGGHYGVLRFSGTAPAVKSTGVGLSASAGVLILIRVDGAITEKASLESFYTSPTQKGKQSSLFEKGPISFIVRIRNEGNIHVKPVGNIEIRDMFGNLVKSLPINKDKSNILPKSIRRFDEMKLDNGWMIGRYTANLTMGYGIKGQAITGTISFWVIPYKIILAGVLILVTLVFIFRQLLKRYNRRIIEKVKNENKTKKSRKG